MSTFNLDSSCAIRAEQCSGQLLWTASSIVLMFQHDSVFFLHSWRWVCTFLVLMFWDRLRRCPLTTASQLGDERWTSVKPLSLWSKLCSLSRGLLGHSGCCQVMMSSQVNIRQPISWTTCMQDWDGGLQWHLSSAVLPLSHRYRAWKCWWYCRHGLILSACTMKFLDGV